MESLTTGYGPGHPLDLRSHLVPIRSRHSTAMDGGSAGNAGAFSGRTSLYIKKKTPVPKGEGR